MSTPTIQDPPWLGADVRELSFSVCKTEVAYVLFVVLELWQLINRIAIRIVVVVVILVIGGRDQHQLSPRTLFALENVSLVRLVAEHRCRGDHLTS